MFKMSAELLALVWAAICLAMFGCNRPHEQDIPSAAPSERVSTISPLRKSLRRITEQPATIEAFDEAPIYAKLSGYLGKVNVDIGDRVRAGDVLAEMSMPELEQEVKQKSAAVAQADSGLVQAKAGVQVAQAAVGSAQARLAEARAAIEGAEADHDRWQSEMQRITELVEKSAVTRKLADETRAQLRSADAARKEAAAKVDSAEAALVESRAMGEKARADEVAAYAALEAARADHARATAMLDYAQLRAPFDGLVTARNVNKGHFVQSASAASAGKPLFVVVSADVVRVFLDVPELDAADTDSGDAATVRVQALSDESRQGKVTRTASALDPTTRTLRTEIDLENSDGRLRPGMYAHVSVTVAERENVLVLPAAAVFREGSTTFCACVASGKIIRQPIQTGLAVGGEIEIVSGLNGDEQVVAKNGAALAEGAAVEAVAAGN